ncbi:siroheme synthase [Pseudooceanicola aestuarii]|uniref:siroheme synthase n=1 Tax=Pseudooceanicola aestuarii TaxID=2697319 RepID=UPI0013D676D4|nr:siroheme synthase [Pseudooceanicola aestuarii]
MRHFPIFVDMDRAHVVLSGGGDAALAKLRLILKTRARVTVHAAHPAAELRNWATQGRLTLTDAPLNAGALAGATLVYAADEDVRRDARTAALAQAAGVLCNIVDDLDGSAFITPAMVDRAPLTIAIGTEGAAPMLARKIKAELEERLPAATAALTRAAQAFRPEAEALPHGRARREFWADWFDHEGPAALAAGSDLPDALRDLRDRHLAGWTRAARITLSFTGSPDPDLMTLKARKALAAADVVVHDAAIAPAVLELARREAKFVSLSGTPEVPPLHALLAGETRGGAHVLYLGATSLPQTLVAACRATGIDTQIIPGLPAQDTAELRETA